MRGWIWHRLNLKLCSDSIDLSKTLAFSFGMCYDTLDNVLSMLICVIMSFEGVAIK